MTHCNTRLSGETCKEKNITQTEGRRWGGGGGKGHRAGGARLGGEAEKQGGRKT